MRSGVLEALNDIRRGPHDGGLEVAGVRLSLNVTSLESGRLAGILFWVGIKIRGREM